MIFQCRMRRAGMVCLGSTTRTMKNPRAPAAACATSSMALVFLKVAAPSSSSSRPASPPRLPRGRGTLLFFLETSAQPLFFLADAASSSGISSGQLRRQQAAGRRRILCAGRHGGSLCFVCSSGRLPCRNKCQSCNPCFGVSVHTIRNRIWLLSRIPKANSMAI